MATAIVFSGINILTASLVEYLLNTNCQVFLVSKDHEEWKKYSNFGKNHDLKIFADNRYLPRECSYIFSVNGLGYLPEKEYQPSEVKDYILWANEYSKDNSAKFINILPYLLANDYQKTSIEVYNNVKNELSQNHVTIFVGELYGKGMQLMTSEPATNVLRESVFSSVVSLPMQNQNIYLSYVEDVVYEIVKNIFSFGVSSKEFVITQTDSIYNFYQTLLKIKPILSNVKEHLPEPGHVNISNIVTPERQTPNSLEATIDWLSSYAKNFSIPNLISNPQSIKKDIQVNTSKKEIKAKSKKPIGKIRNFKPSSKSQTFLLASVLVFIVIVSSPFIALLMSVLGLKYSFAEFSKGNVQSVERVLVISTGLANFSKGGLSTLSVVPGGKEFFTFAKNVSDIVGISGKIAIDTIDISKDGGVLLNSFFGNSDADLITLSKSISAKSSNLYTSSSILKSQVDNLSPAIKQLIPIAEIAEYNKYLYTLTKLSPQLPELLGVGKPKTYLIVFQNNMELRPTGGFIGSFALVTLNSGKLADIQVYDVYSADGQLKGHVEPPSAIKNYLGEANWYLRDSNWNPDFSESAKQMEWFLSKEIDRDVDGVIGIDMEVAKSLLSYTGPLKLADFDQTVTDKNVYEKIQYEVESEFFPGSQKKDNILTSLVRAILAELVNIKNEDAMSFSKMVFENLKQKHIQIYLHNSSAQEGIVAANWGGNLKKGTCSTFNCQEITTGVVEANVGVNKANYFIKRDIDLNSKLVGNGLQNTLTLTLENNATPALGLKGKYKTFVRNFVEKGSGNLSIEIVEATGSRYPEPEIVEGREFVEMGTLVELQPGQKKKIVFKWGTPLKVNLSQSGSVVFNLRKQAGTLADPVTASLTIVRDFKYNTVLAEDKAFTASW